VVRLAKGFSVGAAAWEKHGLWNKDPVMLPSGRRRALAGLWVYAGPSDRHATEVLTKYILTDMDAKGVQGMPAADGLIAKIHA
jgi:multiple sugar transport system substrate-binding protein